MKRAFIYSTAVLLVAFAAIAIAAQDDYHKYEVFGGFAYANYDNALKTIDDGIDPTISLRGVNAEFTYNIHRHVGFTFDYSLTSNRKTFVDPTVNLEVKYKNNQFFGGVQVKNNVKDGTRWRPFGHLLVGFADQRFNANGSVLTPGRVNLVATSLDTQDFSMLLGGGLDVKVHDHIDIRAVQFDFNPIFFGDKTLGGFNLANGSQNNIRMSFGVVFH